MAGRGKTNSWFGASRRWTRPMGKDEHRKLKVDNPEPLITLDDMSKYTITFTVYTSADPSSILDAAHECGNDLVQHIEATGSIATVVEDETCVSEAEASEAEASEHIACPKCKSSDIDDSQCYDCGHRWETTEG